MSITYTYTVTSVDNTAKTMNVKYESVGKPSFTLILPQPLITESVANTVSKFAPISIWEEMDRSVASVTAGASSNLTTPTVNISQGILFIDFYGLFTNAERDLLISATQTDIPTKRNYDELFMLDLVSVIVPQVTALLNRLVVLGLLTNTRKTEILSAMP